MLKTPKKGYSVGLTITDAMRITKEEDAHRIATYPNHTVEGLPASVNWQNVNGKDWTKPVRDQDGCGCYDDETEVLCKSGWKLFKDVTKEDEILCYNKETKELRYDHPLNLFEYDYNGKLIQIKGSSIDLLVTPNHNMLVSKWNEAQRTVPDKEEFVRADSLGWYVNIPCAGKWNGEPRSSYTIKGCEIGPYNNLNDHNDGEHCYGFREGFAVPMNDWVPFLGAYLADGYTTPQNHFEVGITAKKEKKVLAFGSILEKMPFHSKYNKKDRYIVNSKRLSKCLEPLGHATEKYVPDYIKGLTSEQIKMFLQGFGLGDGQWIEDTQTWRFYTSSKKLADDLQELVIKSGKWAKISVRGPRVSEIRGRKIHPTGPE